VQYLGICDGNMAEGSFRCDANVSIRPRGQETFGTRAEIKNINSFRFVERAINYEVERQIDILEGGGEVVQETRLYDADKDETRSMRSKEEANDYRYFPDPDLLPVELDDKFLEQVRASLPELPEEKRQRFIEQYQLPEYDAGILTSSRDMADYFEKVVEESACEAKIAANWIIGDLSARLNKDDMEIAQSPVSAGMLADLLKRIGDKTISGKMAKDVFNGLWEQQGSVDDIIDKMGGGQITDSSAIEALIDGVIAANPAQVEQYRSGKDKVFGFFVGQVMKASKGKANPAQVNDILKQKLKG
jgi:aspartyl-tRNA(Asn)/glutamyl-tRNA(Gln) amidotransferase subunit B